MSSFLLLLSAACLVAFVVFLSRAQRKRPGAARKAWLSIGGMLGFLVLGALVAPSPSAGDIQTVNQQALPSETTQIGIITPDEPEAAPSETTQTGIITPDEPATAPVAQAPASLPPMPFLPGMTQADLTLNLKNFNWGKVLFGKNQDSRCGNYGTPDGGTAEVCMYGQGDHIGRIVANVSTSRLLADRVLPYIATVPFDGSDGAAARAWVTAALPGSKVGKIQEKTISGAKYMLYGDPDGSVFLEVLHPQHEAWSNEVLSQQRAD